ncbi:hypothetical protein POTOM_053295 [Populus tomentosa]|uniref:Uncharacterized protein n=1 Tax=Populus tomentosa TaxID=118781 RepID=A0A8X7Y1N9_POPTO|nr:hypothetical protein POTOM_053295 [Populus tomentosa]
MAFPANFFLGFFEKSHHSVDDIQQNYPDGWSFASFSMDRSPNVPQQTNRYDFNNASNAVKPNTVASGHQTFLQFTEEEYNQIRALLGKNQFCGNVTANTLNNKSALLFFKLPLSIFLLSLVYVIKFMLAPEEATQPGFAFDSDTERLDVVLRLLDGNVNSCRNELAAKAGAYFLRSSGTNDSLRIYVQNMDEETANKYSMLKGINVDVNPALNQM